MQKSNNGQAAISSQGLSRDRTWQTIQDQPTWDVCVVGGGATGLGTALDAAARGYSVVLAEAEDFASGASSRSSKMLHGGVRYLQQLDFSLVKEALHERATVLANAPHVARVLPFVIPCESLAHAAFYGSGLKLYDLLAGRKNVGRSHYISSEEISLQANALKTRAHGIQYFNGLFDDARLAQSIALSARQRGAVLMNYCTAEIKGQADDGTDLIILTRKDNSAKHTLAKKSSQFSRAHLVERLAERTLRVVGGKWTTYRRMAQDALDAAIVHGILPKSKPCSTDQIALSPNPLLDNAWLTQGQWSDEQIQKIVKSAVQDEAACSVDDILYRRLRTGFTDQAVALNLQPKLEHWLKKFA